MSFFALQQMRRHLLPDLHLIRGLLLVVSDDGGDFYFKVADGVADPAEIMDYYATGRSLPMGRLSYLYQMDK